jgi:hypothetical protein
VYVAAHGAVWSLGFGLLRVGLGDSFSWNRMAFYAMFGAAFGVFNLRTLRRWRPEDRAIASRPRCDAEADITFLPAGEGGRRRPIVDGYQGDLYYDDAYWLAMYSFPGGAAEPGETTSARLTFVSPELHRGRLYPGKEFEVREGRRVVARGQIAASFETDRIQSPT